MSDSAVVGAVAEALAMHHGYRGVGTDCSCGEAFDKQGWVGWRRHVGEVAASLLEGAPTGKHGLCAEDDCPCWASGVQSVERQLEEVHLSLLDAANTVKGHIEMAVEAAAGARTGTDA